jgi:crotonobetainyl-CoA:carnitine CoA-transferase CaiB-like acyl-CoA transferase
VRAEVQAILTGKTRDEWTAIFAKADACCEPILEMDELAAHPQHQARKMFFSIDHPQGAIPQLRTPVGRPEARRIAPRLGEHSADVLAEYGFTRDEVDALRTSGAVA